MEKVSVIIPTYNRAHLLPRAIQSVINQTYPHWELIVVDDGSTDNTSSLMATISDQRIKYIKLEKNGGNAVARNVGVRMAKGEYITFLDSDDEYLNTYLEEFSIAISNNPSVSFFFGGYELCNTKEKKCKPVIWNPRGNNRGEFLYELKIGTGCGIVLHRKCFDYVGLFDERLRVAVDTDFLIRLEAEFGYFIIPKPLVRVYDHSGTRLRKDMNQVVDAYKLIISKNNDRIMSDPNLIYKWYYKLMWINFHANKKRDALESYQILLQNNLVNIKVLIIKMIFIYLPTVIAKRIHKLFKKILTCLN